MIRLDSQNVIDNMIEDFIRNYRNVEERIVVDAVRKEFPFLLRHYPKIRLWEKFLITKIIRIKRHVIYGLYLGYEKDQVWYTYKFIGCSTEHTLIEKGVN